MRQEQYINPRNRAVRRTLAIGIPVAIGLIAFGWYGEIKDDQRNHPQSTGIKDRTIQFTDVIPYPQLDNAYLGKVGLERITGAFESLDRPYLVSTKNTRIADILGVSPEPDDQILLSVFQYSTLIPNS